LFSLFVDLLAELIAVLASFKRASAIDERRRSDDSTDLSHARSCEVRCEAAHGATLDCGERRRRRGARDSTTKSNIAALEPAT
jgi:hypothetical protein